MSLGIKYLSGVSACKERRDFTSVGMSVWSICCSPASLWLHHLCASLWANLCAVLFWLQSLWGSVAMETQAT